MTVKNEKIKEKLADLCHEQWSGWMKHLFSLCKISMDGELYIPHELVQRWHRQMNTGYDGLSCDEKDSDRGEAERFIMVIKKYYDSEQEV